LLTPDALAVEDQESKFFILSVRFWVGNMKSSLQLLHSFGLRRPVRMLSDPLPSVVVGCEILSIKLLL
jgi:hypothetical protein